MPNGPRIRANNVYGIINDNPLTAASGTFNSTSLPLLPIVSAAHAVIVFDPKRVHGDPEIVVVTAHTAASTVASVLRGQYGTSPREHPQGTAWAHVPIDEDYTEIVTSLTRPSDPYLGQMVFEEDTDKFVARNAANSNWVDAIPLGAWQTYTPTLTQNAVTVTKTVNYAGYIKIGRIVMANVLMTVTGPGAVGAIEIGLPLSSVLVGNASIGNFYVADASASPFNFMGIAAPTSNLTVRGLSNANAQYLGVAGSAMPNALASGDVLSISVVYETTI